MGLETGDFIDDLVETNPVTATDPVTEGAAHLRLVKKVLLASFPGVDAAVTLTSAQLNDAALKTPAQTIAGAWDFTAQSEFSAGLALGVSQTIVGRDSGSTQQLWARFTGADLFVLGNAVTDSRLDGGAKTSFNIGGSEVAAMQSAATGSLLIGDTGGTLRRVARAEGTETIPGSWTFEAATRCEGNFTVPNLVSIVGEDGVGTGRTMCRFNGNVLELGSSARSSKLITAATHDTFITTEQVLSAVARASGSLLVYDRSGNLKKAGFRNPEPAPQAGGKTTSETDEGRIIQFVTGSALTMGLLADHETYRCVWTNGAGSIARGANTSMFWMNGDGSTLNRATLQVAENSVVEFYHFSATEVWVFGNGISP